jgi:hypothetical protein
LPELMAEDPKLSRKVTAMEKRLAGQRRMTAGPPSNRNVKC